MQNDRQTAVVERLRQAGHMVYDFHHTTTGDDFDLDMQALNGSDVVVFVLPGGRSSHMEAGHVVGQGKPLMILQDNAKSALMYKMADVITDDLNEIVKALEGVEV